MAQNSKIEWTHHTANLWHGCTKVHEGCDHCYAETLSHRWGRDIWGNDKPRMIINSVWKDLARFQKEASAAGEMHRVFVGSMMDIFEKPMPLIDSKGEMVTDGVHYYPADTGQLRDQLFEEISEGKYPNLLFLLLTKRPSNINKYIPEAWKRNPPANVMFGCSVVNQPTADKLIPQLLQVKGKRFLSMEPLLGPVDLSTWFKDWKCKDCRGTGVVGFGLATRRCPNMCHRSWMEGVMIDWVIVGGESGHGARPMNPQWARDLRDQCTAAGVPFLFKQWGEYVSVSEVQGPQTGFHIFPDGRTVRKVGKKEAGRLLDGRTWDEFPKTMEVI